jgi:peptidoglycan/LPS O-acetylase OafA/YrhL
MPALDGLRAVAIASVLVYHGGIGWAAGGFLGVNVFFVLSGFLITLLLLKEWTRTSTIRLGAFWARRARRLLPALLVLLGGILLYAWLLAPTGTQASLRGDALSTLFYVGNWHQIVAGQSYFAHVSAPSPLLHTWTLAIEEQFYLVWPLVVLGVLTLRRSTRVLLGVTLAGIAFSALEMALRYHNGMDPSRLYYGTDSRAQDILVGAAVAILLRQRAPAIGRSGNRRYSVLAGAAVVGFAVVWWATGGGSSLLYRGGFLLADFFVALVIVGVIKAPGGLVARALSLGPVRFLGRISYGLYLWHWPVFLVVDHARTGLDGLGLFAVRCAVSLAFAVCSWYLVEKPVRQLSFRGRRSWVLVPVGVLAVTAVLAVGDVGGEAPQNLLLNTSNVRSALPASIATTRGDRPAPTILFLGDSLSLTVAGGFLASAPRYGIVVQGRPMPGCGLATDGPYIEHGGTTTPISPCSSWPALWTSYLDQFHPRVVVLTEGWWETMTQWYEGRWRSLLDPGLAADETLQYERAVTVLHSEGAKVALTTSPYFDSGEQLDGQPWPEDDPARVDRLNAIIEQVAAHDPGFVSVIPLNHLLDPGGHFTWTIDGKVVRMVDGVHTTFAAGDLLAPKVLPGLVALAGHT